MYAGRIVESGPAADIFRRPRHPYTMGLLRSVPRLDRPRQSQLATIEGMPPDLRDPPPGCRFAPRCPHRIAVCATPVPLVTVGRGHVSACHRAKERLRNQAVKKGSALSATDLPDPILSVRNLRTHFKVGRSIVKAVDEVSFDVPRGRTLGLVGESGCGKTTVGRTVLRLVDPTGGEMTFEGIDLAKIRPRQLAKLRRRVQVIFQDPYNTLNPRMTVQQILAEPLLVHRLAPNRAAAADRVADLLAQVGLLASMATRYPHQLSGGQRQRVGIARALAFEPSFIVLDEPVSALDVSIQGQIVNLLESLQTRLGLTYLFIAHDLAVVRHIAHRVAVMYLGRVMEIADRDVFYDKPLHPYTQALLDAAPVPDPAIERRRTSRPLKGEVPSALTPPPGCVFHTRCPLADADCRAVVPPLREAGKGHMVACIKV
jgi:peptide/nickel transport system ATP-binding protein